MTDHGARATHPYLNFRVDLRQAPISALLLLGEAKSKIEHISNAPTLPEVQAEMHMLYLAKGLHATTAIEGNTLTEEQVRQIVEDRFQASASMEYQAIEIRNVLDACNGMTGVDWSSNISADDLCEYNRLIQKDLEVEEHVIPGDYRSYVVTAGGYRAPHAQEVPGLMREFIQWLKDFPLDALGANNRLHMAVLKAIYAHLFFVWIHPFGDGNGRTARIIELRVLLASGVPTPVAHLLSNHYNMTRTMYYRRLNDAQRDTWKFVEYAVQGLVDGLAEQITSIQEQQKIVLWGHLVRDLIRGDSLSASRKRTLARALAHIDGPVRKADIPHLTVELAEKYAGKTQKTVSRDVAELLKLKLVKPIGSQIEANWDQVLSLLPAKLSE